MSDSISSPFPPEAPERLIDTRPSPDTLVPFAIDALDARGRLLALGPQLDVILSRHDYPPAVARLVAQAVTLAALLGSSMKFDGKLIIQTSTNGPVDMVVADYTAPNKLRGYARFDADRLDETGSDAANLIGEGYLALTLDQGEHMQRYQGIVPLENGDLAGAAHAYFDQSEQIPTRIRLAVGEAFEKDGDGNRRHSWRAGGLLVQHLPADGGTPRDLDPGDASADPGHAPEWDEVLALMSTVEDHELVDETLSAERLLYRLFHERGVRVFETLELAEHCSCSRDRLEDVLRRLEDDERKETAEDGAIAARCEFCGATYRFTLDELEAPKAP